MEKGSRDNHAPCVNSGSWNLVCLICVIMITIHYSLLTHFGLCGFLEQSLFYYTFANNHSLCSVNSSLSL